MTRDHRQSCLGLLLLAALLASGWSLASEKMPETKGRRQVRVSVVIILACEKSTKVAPQLEGVAEEVRKLHNQLKGFRLEKLGCKALKVGDSHQFDLPEGKAMTVVVQRAADKMDQVRLKVKPPLMGEITYETPCGKFLPIVTPLRTKKNELVIVAIRVQPCAGK